MKELGMKDQESILLTGAAGFIGFHTAQDLLHQGYHVLGIDNFSPYYDISLKYARVQLLKEKFPNTFTFAKADITDRPLIDQLWESIERPITRIVHLAAQAGVRYSLVNTYEYVYTNVMGHLVMMEKAS